MIDVLDTDIVPELRKVRNGKVNPGVAVWAEEVSSVELFVSAITMHELDHGVLLLERSDPVQGALLREWLDHSVAAAFKNRVLQVGRADRSSRRCAARTRLGSASRRPHRRHRPGERHDRRDPRREGLSAFRRSRRRQPVELRNVTVRGDA